MNRSLLIFMLFCVSVVAFAQKEEKVTASYTYYVPENITLEEAKRTALDRAKFSAIADAFGTLVTQNNSTILSNQNGHSDSRFFSLGGSEVKGEWIETTSEPKYDIRYDGNMLVVSVTVVGRIREIASADIDVIAKILRNGTDERFESSEFRNGDDMYLYFKSPVDGYLTVYLLDEEMQKVYCLLPYRTSGNGAYRIKHDYPYILFSVKNELVHPSMVDEYTMTCSREVEFNDIYIIFSPNPFAKANSNEANDDALPRQLSFKDFQKWIKFLKTKDINSTIINKQLTIKN